MTPPPPASRPDRPGPAVRRRQRAVVTFAVTVVLLAALGAGLAWQARSPAPPDPAGARQARDLARMPDPPPAPVLPCVGVPVGPGDDLQRAVDAHPAGTSFCLAAGVHRLAHALPKDGQRFVGEGRGTVLSGAKVLRAADARQDGPGRWHWDGQTQRSEPHGELIGPGHAEAPNPGDRYNEELFVTASGDPADPPRRYRRVLTLAELGHGRWYFDEAADRIYLADDPARLGLIETSVTPAALPAPPGTHPHGVVVENLVVEKYASPAQQAAVGGEGGSDWTLRDVTIRSNHGAGAELGPGTLMEHCKVHDMGQIGLLGGGDATTRPTVLRSTEVAFNKTLSFDPDWEAGGTKFTRVHGKGMIVERSWFHHNHGGGLWFDIDNYGVVIRSNRFEANDRWGVLYEISRQAEIYWNEALATTSGPERLFFHGAGIVVSNSAGVNVHQNLLDGNDNGILLKEDATRTAPPGTVRQPLPHIHDVDVHDNDVGMRRGVTGMRVDGGDPGGDWRQAGVRFAGNRYRLDRDGERFVGVGNDVVTFDQWQALGNDTGGTALPAATVGSLPPGATAFAMTSYGARDGGGS